MRRPPDPHRVLAHALAAGDARLAALLAARLGAACRRDVPVGGDDAAAGRRAAAVRRTVDRLAGVLGLD